MARSASAPIDHDDLSVVDLVVDRGRSTVLEIDALRIPHGYTALVGPNGSGKTTLLHVFAGLIEPRTGTIEFGMCAPGTDSTRLAYVLQSQQASEHLLVTAREVVALARSARHGVFGRLDRTDRLAIDEPVAGLDLASSQTIRRAIDEERAAGRTVVVATHDLEEARRADCVVMLAGRVVAAGAPVEVLRAENLRAAYHGRVIELGDGLMTVDDAHHHDH